MGKGRPAALFVRSPLPPRAATYPGPTCREPGSPGAPAHRHCSLLPETLVEGGGAALCAGQAPASTRQEGQERKCTPHFFSLIRHAEPRKRFWPSAELALVSGSWGPGTPQTPGEERLVGESGHVYCHLAPRDPTELVRASSVRGRLCRPCRITSVHRGAGIRFSGPRILCLYDVVGR